MANSLWGRILCTPIVSWFFPPNPLISLSRPWLYHHLKTQSQVISLYLSMPWSSVNTVYSIHRVQHTLSTAYTMYCINPRSTVCRSQPVSYLLPDHVGLNSLHSNNAKFKNEYCLSSHGVSLPNCRLQINLLQVLLQSRLITASKCISKLAQSWPDCVSLTLHN